jgi:hypothetical protein
MSREKAIAALYGAVVDDRGRWWGEIATDRQREDAEALLDPTGLRFHFQTRPRGGSKTTDLAAALAVSLIFPSKHPIALSRLRPTGIRRACSTTPWPGSPDERRHSRRWRWASTPSPPRAAPPEGIAGSP